MCLFGMLTQGFKELVILISLLTVQIHRVLCITNDLNYMAH